MPNPPYGIIGNAMKEGTVVPFLGAGANLSGRDTGSWKDEDSPFLPSGAELSDYLARLSEFPSNDAVDRHDLAKVASYYSDVGGRRELRQCLRSIFNRDFAPHTIHLCLAEVAASNPLLILTTNYDDLTEQACRSIDYDLVTHITDRDDWAAAVLVWTHRAGDPHPRDPKPIPPAQLDQHVSLGEKTVIYKMHGAVDRILNQWDSFVITEDDYVEFLARMTEKTAIPAAFIEYFCRRRFLFLGYSLRDWNLRIVLRDLFVNRDKDLGPSWAIQATVPMLEKHLWDSRGVDIYEEDLERFGTELRRALVEESPGRNP